SSAALYDSASNTWSAAGSMATARYGHTATLLPSGTVLIAGGSANAPAIVSAELYNPPSNTRSSTRTTALDVCRTTLTPSGNGLVIGNGPSGSASQVYDPISNTWSSTVAMTYPIFSPATATLLPNGKVLALVSDVGSGVIRAELYDPASNTWSVAPMTST